MTKDSSLAYEKIARFNVHKIDEEIEGSNENLTMQIQGSHLFWRGIQGSHADSRKSLKYLAEKTVKKPLNPMTAVGFKSLETNQSVLIVAKSAPPPPQTINKSLALVGIGITSVVFLVLLRVLFRKDPKTILANVSNKPPLNGGNSINIFDDEQIIMNEEEFVSPQLFSLMAMDSMARQPKEQGRQVDPAENHRPVRLRSNNYGRSYTLSKENRDWVEVDSENGGTVKIVTSQTTEIDVVSELIRDLQQSDRNLRRKAIWELGQMSDSRSIRPLIEIMPQAAPLDRSLILGAITQIAHRNFASIQDILFASLEDESLEVRISAIRDLIILHQPTSQLTERLSKMLRDPDQEVRRTANWALKKINPVSFSRTQNYPLKATNDENVSYNGRPKLN